MLRLGHKIYKMSLENLLVPESTEVLYKLYLDKNVSKGHRGQFTKFTLTKCEQFEQGIKVVLGHCGKYKYL
jgi:hypothetical protein